MAWMPCPPHPLRGRGEEFVFLGCSENRAWHLSPEERGVRGGLMVFSRRTGAVMVGERVWV